MVVFETMLLIMLMLMLMLVMMLMVRGDDFVDDVDVDIGNYVDGGF